MRDLEGDTLAAVHNAVVGPPLDDVTEVEVDGQACLYSPRGDAVVMLNQTASDIWFLCDGSLSEDQIVSRLAASYDVTARSIDTDVRSTIRSFLDAGLLPTR